MRVKLQLVMCNDQGEEETVTDVIPLNKHHQRIEHLGLTLAASKQLLSTNSVRHNSCCGSVRRWRYTIDSYATRTGAYPSCKQEGHRHGALPAALAVRGDSPRVQIFSPAGPALCPPPPRRDGAGPRREPAVVLRSVCQLAVAVLL